MFYDTIIVSYNIWQHLFVRYIYLLTILCSFQLEYISMVPTFAELKEPNIATIQKEEEEFQPVLIKRENEEDF